ncbi:TetR/AcrR family transcriptional regulator [Propionibacteriaceae bacterium G1746]
MARPKLHDDQLRQRLLDAATDLVATKGDTFALRPLAESLDTSTTAIYSLFGSRHALLEAVAENVATSFAAAIRDVHHDDPLLWIVGLATAYRRWGRASQARFAIMTGTAIDTEELRAARDKSKEPLAAAVAAAIEQGYLEGPILLTATTLFAGVHGFVTLEFAGDYGGDKGFYQVVDRLLLSSATPRGRERVAAVPARDASQHVEEPTSLTGLL